MLANLGSGKGYSIKELVNTIINSNYVKNKPKIVFDKTKPSGDKIRILSTKNAKKYGVYSISNFQDSIDQTIKWYLENRSKVNLRFNYFN